MFRPHLLNDVLLSTRMTHLVPISDQLGHLPRPVLCRPQLVDELLGPSLSWYHLALPFVYSCATWRQRPDNASSMT